jgi:hypothetical protein
VCQVGKGTWGESKLGLPDLECLLCVSKSRGILADNVDRRIMQLTEGDGSKFSWAYILAASSCKSIGGNSCLTLFASV